VLLPSLERRHAGGGLHSQKLLSPQTDIAE